MPSKRFTVDDIAAHWWVNLGYKYPPVHYYLTPAMRQNGVPAQTNVPALTYKERPKGTTIISEQIQKPTMSSNQSRKNPMTSMNGTLTVTSPQNGHHTDTSSKGKPTVNGYQTLGRSHRLFNNDLPTTNGTEQNGNQKPTPSKRRTSLDRNQRGSVNSAQISLPRTLIY